MVAILILGISLNSQVYMPKTCEGLRWWKRVVSRRSLLRTICNLCKPRAITRRIRHCSKLARIVSRIARISPRGSLRLALLETYVLLTLQLCNQSMIEVISTLADLPVMDVMKNTKATLSSNIKRSSTTLTTDNPFLPWVPTTNHNKTPTSPPRTSESGSPTTRSFTSKVCNRICKAHLE